MQEIYFTTFMSEVVKQAGMLQEERRALNFKDSDPKSDVHTAGKIRFQTKDQNK